MSAPPSPVPPRHLAIVGALRAFGEGSDHAADLASRGLGLNRTDLRALSVLLQRAGAGEETTVTDLGRSLHLTKASATAAVDRLVASGHARRRRSEVDRRRVLVDHTDSAVADGGAAFAPLALRISAALADLDDADLDAALRVVRAATAALEDHVEDLASRSGAAAAHEEVLP